ncbi:aminotransferase class V-fold PLP-dependent enzyme [Campylobacter sp. RM13119]|uniref:aminotransferase class V-fold PLP-dependent enzyme n=1 Tax=Campylobacter californiensis TaxID=1032243 RepID=UPI001475A063|nr:aminotransferase class V-fold PLP-dependent enzyme [Campylobacter sp. RM13119]MBE3605760.1 aminotransferase class V-fold PLP-dependent enzyme [Campylobacter sp. RM13119]
MINLEHIRRNIILQDGIYYFDYTASGLAYESIEDRIRQMLKSYANTHSDSSSSAVATQNLYEESRKKLKQLLGLDDSFYLLPCGYGSTAAIKKFQELTGLYIPPKTRKRYHIKPTSNPPLVIIGPYEHHSNEVSFREAMCDVVRVGLSKEGGIDFTNLEQILQLNSKREIIASFSVASNVTGVISDYKKIYELVRRYGGILALDAASFSAYANVDCNYFDALFLSPHKLLGGVGSCGLLAIKKELATDEEPTFAGGGTVSYVSRRSHMFVKDTEQLEQGGTPPITQLVRARFAYELRGEIGFDNICENENELGEYFEQGIAQIPDLINYRPKDLKKLPIFSFNIKDISPYDFAALLSNDYGIQTRAGCACAGPYGHELLGMKDDVATSQKPGWVRVSLHYTHTFEDVDYLINAIKESIKKYRNMWAEERSLYAIMG